MKIIFSEKSGEYFKEGEPEAPFRVLESYKLLKEKGFKFIEPDIASEKDILRVHSKELMESVKTRGIKNPELFDSDLAKYENIFYYASLSAGGAVKSMETCFKDDSFSLMRPPGHHAGKIAEGFCFFNNVAIAVAKAIAENKVKKVAILDIDLHHGNGTQDIFLGNKNIIYVSLHQSPLYPETGLKNIENCYNFPLIKETNETAYLKTLKKALNEIIKFNPDLIAVSAGFDTYKEDSLGELKLEINTYKKIAKLIKNLGKPVFSVLEGGYSKQLPDCINSYINGFSA